MPDIQNRFNIDMLVLEGAMGTMLQRSGVTPETCGEFLNLIEPDLIAGIHANYHMVGADCATSNTFSGSRPKLAEYGLEDQLEAINRAGVELARQGGAPHVLADIGPTGLVMQPLGPATFDEIFEYFAEQARALTLGNPDAFILETFTDIAELRCAVRACKSVSDLPVIASATFGERGRMDLSGTTPEQAAIILKAAGADALGLNCGLGPEQMLPLVSQMTQATTLPVFVQPNAGLPTLNPVTQKTEFPGTPDEMARFAVLAREAGVTGIGSCCGSTPAFTGAIATEISGRDVIPAKQRFNALVLAGPRGLCEVGNGPLRLIGERINPTGKKELRESLLAGSMSIVRRFATEQAASGADLLDVNVGAAGVKALGTLGEAVMTASSVADVPLVIDTTDFAALEDALKRYPGKALINSVNGEARSYETVLPLAKKYGAALIVLALDEDGIPATVQGRLDIVKRIAGIAEEFGIERNDLLVDSLVMTAAADRNAPEVTLKTSQRVKEELGLYTVLGVSNVSHGLPMRGLLNAGFLTAAAGVGLDAAIVNPNDPVVRDARGAINSARERGEDFAAQARFEFDALLNEAFKKSIASATEEEAPAYSEQPEAVDPEVELRKAIARGDAQGAPAWVDALIADGLKPATIIGEVLTPAINALGDKFGRGEVFLPQLMVAADAMKAGVAQAKSYLSEADAAATQKGRVAFATVKGDIHSIGKDICISLLESQGFEVRDLGVDVAPEEILEAARDVDVVCLSALMTTTLPAMEQTKKLLESHLPEVGVEVGGAVVTREWADSIGALYSDDAPSCVAVLEEFMRAKRERG